MHKARLWRHDHTSSMPADIDVIARREDKLPRSIRAVLSFASLALDVVLTARPQNRQQANVPASTTQE
jgi:hypothetical protein